MPNNISRLAKNLAANGPIDRAGAQALIDAAKDGPGITENEKKELNKVLNRYADKFEANAKFMLQDILLPAPTGSGDFDKDGLTNDQEAKLGTSARLADTDGDGLHDGVEVNKYKLDPKSNQNTVEVPKTWTTTYWPMAGSGNPDGSPRTHLWATGGALDKFDDLMKARGNEDGAKALEFERKPALNWLVGDRDKGHYIPKSQLKEANAEMTTGVDFDGDGKITEGVKVDFLNARGDFAAVSNRGAFTPTLGEEKLTSKLVDAPEGQEGKVVEYYKADGTKLTEEEHKNVILKNPNGDGKADGSLGVGWWGSCDKVALAGILFQDPKHDVTLDGVTFTKQDIRGLLTVIANSQADGTDFMGSRYDEKPDIVVTKDGRQVNGTITSVTGDDFRTKDMWRWNGDFMVKEGSDKEVKLKLADGTEKTYAADEIKYLAREDKKDMNPADYHTTVKKWLSEGRGAAFDKDSGSHVWNYNFHKAEFTEKKVENFNREEAIGHHGPAGDGEIRHYSSKIYFGNAPDFFSYWLEYKDGDVVNGGWKGKNPDFMWRPGDNADFTGHNDRNPFVKPEFIKEIYEASIAEQPLGDWAEPISDEWPSSETAPSTSEP